jgi:hypothetical protein
VIIVDEFSFVDAKMMHVIDRSLRQAKNETAKPFGGLHVIFMGDFRQLKPVTGDPLFTNPGVLRGKSASGKYAIMNTAAAAGVEEWRSIDIVVELDQQMRQCSDQREFVDLLARVRDGDATTADVDFLNHRWVPMSPLLQHQFASHKCMWIASRHQEVNEINVVHTACLARFHDIANLFARHTVIESSVGGKRKCITKPYLFACRFFLSTGSACLS